MVSNHARKNAAKAHGGKHTAALRRIEATAPRPAPLGLSRRLSHPLPDWNDDRDAMLLVTGAPGSGKTTTLQNLVTACLLQGWECAAIEFGNYAGFAFAGDWLRDLADDTASAVDALHQLSQELTARQHLLMEHQVSAIKDLPVELRPPKILIAIDGEWPEGASTEKLWHLVREGRAAGIRVVYAVPRVTEAMTRWGGITYNFTGRLHIGPIAGAEAVAQFDDAERAARALASVPSRGVGVVELSGMSPTTVALPDVDLDGCRGALAQLTVRERPARVRASASRLRSGDRVKLCHDGKNTGSRWWSVRIADGRFTILTRQADFRPKGEVFYTIIDWVRGVRGPCDLLFPAWDMATDEGCTGLLAALHAQAHSESNGAGLGASGSTGAMSTGVSRRNNVPVRVLAHQPHRG